MNMMVKNGLPKNIECGVDVLTTGQYIGVLQNEIEILKHEYYKGNSGNYGTAIGVLEMRIKQIEKEALDESRGF